MAPSRSSQLSTAAVAAVLLLAAVPVALAHGGDEMEAMPEQSGHDAHAHVAEPVDDIEYPPTYFAHGEHVGLMYAHIGLMAIAWILVLPLGVYNLSYSKADQ